jgi:SPP1 family predicted phage head-tail adaptor
MQAGTLRYRMSIEQKGTARSGSGAPVETWSTFAFIWAGFESLGGRELEAAQKLVAEANCKITLRYIPGVVPEMRVNWFDRRANNTRLFDILSSTDEMERHRSLELLCREHDLKPGA